MVSHSEANSEYAEANCEAITLDEHEIEYNEREHEEGYF